MNERTFYRKAPPSAKRKLEMATDTEVAGTSTDTAGQTVEDPKTAEKEAKKKKPIDVSGTYRRLF